MPDRCGRTRRLERLLGDGSVRRLRRRGQSRGAALCRSTNEVGRTDRGAEAGGGQADRLSVRRRAERHLASLRRLHQGGGGEGRLEGHHHRRQRQPDLLACRHEPGDRAEAGGHRPLRRRRQLEGPDQERGGAGHQIRRPARRRPARPAAGSQPLRQHPGGSARDRQGRGRLGDRRFQRDRPGRRPVAQRICHRRDQVGRHPRPHPAMRRLQAARLRQLAGVGGCPAPAAADHQLGAALRPPLLCHVGRRQ